MVKHVILWRLSSELSAEEKNKISHRSNAIRLFARALRERI